MGQFFFDESIQERGGFIIGAFVYTDDDPSPAVYAALVEAGRTPGVDEFKSSARMSGDARLARLRGRLSSLLWESKIGVLVIPSDYRSELGNEALRCLDKILNANKLIETAHTVYFDEGIKLKPSLVTEFHKDSGECCVLLLNQDSKTIGGLQLADLAAHYLGTMLLEQMGKITKKVLAGDASGYPPDLKMELGFELWAQLRYSFFRSDRGLAAYESLVSNDIDNFISVQTFDVTNYGLYVGPLCSEILYEAAVSRFGKCYLGCIH